MKMRTRSFIGVGVAALGILAWAQSPLTAEEMGLDFWNVGELEKQLAHGERRHAELERNDQVVMNRVRLRRQILDNLLADKITLDEAGRGFAALNATDPTVGGVLKTQFPDGTDIDRAVRQVIKHLACHLTPGSAERAERLRCEGAAARPDLAW